MTSKISVRVILLFLAAYMFFPQHVLGAEPSPEEFVREFYTWYITLNGNRNPINNDGIHHYVVAETVKILKNPYLVDSREKGDYFLKMYDPPINMTGVSISIDNVANMGDYVFVVPVKIDVAFENYRNTSQAVLILKKFNDGLRITKCVDIYPEL